MISAIGSSLSATVTPAAPAVTAKPWALGDPSSFAQLFSPIATGETPAASSTAPLAAARQPIAPTTSSFHELFQPAPVAGAPATPAQPTPAAPTTPAQPTPAAPATPATPTAATGSLVPFTFEQNATISGYGTVTPMNPEELATADTADRLAAMLGGHVTPEAPYGGGFGASVPTRNITFSQVNVTLNAGVTAYLFNTYGDAPGSQAWQQINQLLGRDPMSTTQSKSTT